MTRREEEPRTPPRHTNILVAKSKSLRVIRDAEKTGKATSFEALT